MRRQDNDHVITLPLIPSSRFSVGLTCEVQIAKVHSVSVARGRPDEVQVGVDLGLLSILSTLY